MKYNAGGSNPRSLDPTLTRKKGSLSHPGSLALVAVALIFFAYMFGLLPQLDTYFNALTHSIDGERDTAMTIWNYAPIVGGGIVVLILCVWLYGKMADAMRLSSKKSMVAGRKPLKDQDFIALTAPHGVSTKVAHQTYKYLHHDYGHNMKVALNDDLRRDLHWKQTHLMDVMGNLARHCDRKKNIKADPEAIRTVLDLLLYVESCPKHFLTESSVMRRRAGKAADKPAGQSGMRRAVAGVTRMLKPAHKREDVMKLMETPAEKAEKAVARVVATQAAAPSAPPAAKPALVKEDKPALSFIRPRKYPPLDSQK